MKIKLKVTITGTQEVDSEHYEGNTPEEVRAEQEQGFKDGAMPPDEFVVFCEDYDFKVEVVS